MKKYLLSLLVLMAICMIAKAQISLGIKGGVNFSKINTDDLNSSTLTGYQAGLFARIGNGLYLQPEMYLSGTGGQFNSTNDNFSAKVRFTDLVVPLLIGGSFGSKNLNVRIMAGPVYSSVLNTNFSQSINNLYADFSRYNSSTVGLQAGLGVDIHAITVDLRYEGGLTKINPTYGQTQNLFALSVGFKLL
jgi:hypothetical protein